MSPSFDFAGVKTFGLDNLSSHKMEVSAVTTLRLRYSTSRILLDSLAQGLTIRNLLNREKKVFKNTGGIAAFCLLA
jgi:hypothetical protein